MRSEQDEAASQSSRSKSMYASIVIMFVAHFANSVISLFRMKILALLIGPAGIGLLALFQNLQTTVTTFAGIGLTTSGVRELAAASSDKLVFSRVRQTLFAGLFVQGCIAMLAIWILRDEIAVRVFNEPALGFEVGILSVVILLSMISSSQTALLQGLRRVKEIGIVMTISALVSTLIGVWIIWLNGESGIVWFLLAQAIAAILVARYFTRKLEGTKPSASGLEQFTQSWAKMAKIGFPFMLGALVSTGSLLIVRGGIADWQGMDEAGYFAAAWAISLLYVNFILQALNTDFYPRLSEVGADRDKTNSLVNTQILVSVSIGGPIILFTICLAPWLVTLLYSSSFAPTAELLQWFGIGNVLKLVSLPLAYVLVARGHSVTFLIAELIWNGMFIGLVFGGLDSYGLKIVGMSYFIAYFVFLVSHVAYLGFKFGLTLERPAKLLAVLFFSMACLVFYLSVSLNSIGTTTGLLVSIITSAAGLRIVYSALVSSNAAVPERILKIFRWVGWSLPKTKKTNNET